MNIRHYLLTSLAIAALAAPLQAQSPAPAAKVAVKSAADLPRYSYPLSGDVTRFLDKPAELAPTVAKLKADIRKTLDEYAIEDRATLGQLHRMLREVAVYENDAAAFERHNALVRSYSDKPALKVWTGAVDSARLAARAVAEPGSPAFAAAFSKAFRERLDAIEWAVAGQTVRDRYRGLATAAAGVLRGSVTESYQAAVDRGGGLDMLMASGLLASVNNYTLLPLVDAERAVEKAWIDAHHRPKKDIWADRDFALPASAKLTPVVVGIWDSGTDSSILGPAAWTNKGEMLNGKDDDGNGYVDDVHGVAIDEMGKHVPQTLMPVPAEFASDLARIALINKGNADIGAGIDSPEAAQTIAIMRAMSAAEAKRLVAQLNFYGSYAHGTHVAGIAAAGNPAARLLVARTSFDWRSPPRRPTETTAKDFAQAHKDAVAYFKAHGVRVVNMSWTVGLKDEYEDQLIANGVAPDKAVEEGKRLFAIERQGLYEAISGAPEILFVVSAGNSNDSAEFSGNAPSSFDLPNVLTVAAVDQAGEPTNFTTGGSTVDIAASGYQVEGMMPGGTKVRWSGTSMSSPQVTNAAAKLLALNPRLTVEQVRAALVESATPGAGGLKLLNTRAALARVAPDLKIASSK